MPEHHAQASFHGRSPARLCPAFARGAPAQGSKDALLRRIEENDEAVVARASDLLDETKKAQGTVRGVAGERRENNLIRDGANKLQVLAMLWHEKYYFVIGVGLAQRVEHLRTLEPVCIKHA